MAAALREANLRPRPSLGQHFLHDEALLERQVAYADIGSGDTVLEIGPGIGNLTRRLLAQAGRVIALEVDRRFAPALEALSREHSSLHLVWGDACHVPLPRFDKVVANLPYTPALPLTFRLLEQRFGCAVLLYQASLAQRLCATVGQPGYGRLSVAVGRVAQVELLERVPREAFYPAPRVESALVRLRRVRPRFSVPSEAFFRVLLEALFSYRDQSLAAALASRTVKHALGAGETIAGRRNAAPVLPPDDVRAIQQQLSRRVAEKAVSAVTPREFGRLAWTVWQHGRGQATP